eukprot:gene31042-37520_t
MVKASNGITCKSFNAGKGEVKVKIRYFGPSGQRHKDFRDFAADRESEIVEGLAARVQHAALMGIVNHHNLPVSTAAELKAAIVRFLCSAPHAGVDLGGHNELIQFLPSYHRDAKLEALMTQYSFLKHHGGVNQPPEGAANWPDIVHYAQIISITRANAAVGPIDTERYNEVLRLPSTVLNNTGGRAFVLASARAWALAS